MDRRTFLASAASAAILLAQAAWAALDPSLGSNWRLPGEFEPTKAVWIKFVNVTRLNWQGGGIHCATCNEPQPIMS